MMPFVREQNCKDFSVSRFRNFSRHRDRVAVSNAVISRPAGLSEHMNIYRLGLPSTSRSRSIRIARFKKYIECRLYERTIQHTSDGFALD